MELPETLPGRAGTFEDRTSFSSAIFYSNNPARKSYMIGAEVLTHLTVCGLGLEINSGICLTEFDKGGVGNIIRQGLSLRTQAMEANTLTTKFIMSMSVIDFLAKPNGYVSLKEIGKIVGRHCAKTRQEYDPLLRSLENLCGGKGNGIRTKLIHEGLRLENLFTKDEVRSLFRELDHYIGKMISDMIPYCSQSWTAVEELRIKRKQELGL